MCHILSLVCSYKTNIFCILFIGNWYFHPSNRYMFKQKTKCLNISFLIIYLSLFSSLILWMIKSKTIFWTPKIAQKEWKGKFLLKYCGFRDYCRIICCNAKFYPSANLIGFNIKISTCFLKSVIIMTKMKVL